MAIAAASASTPVVGLPTSAAAAASRSRATAPTGEAGGDSEFAGSSTGVAAKDGPLVPGVRSLLDGDARGFALTGVRGATETVVGDEEPVRMAGGCAELVKSARDWSDESTLDGDSAKARRQTSC